VSKTTKTSFTFVGKAGHKYGFYSVATDKAGNHQATPKTAQASTTINLGKPAAVAPAKVSLEAAHLADLVFTLGSDLRQREAAFAPAVWAGLLGGDSDLMPALLDAQHGHRPSP
jgi:hypothetical protein